MMQRSEKQVEYHRKWDCQYYDDCLTKAAVKDDKQDFCIGCPHYVKETMFEPNLMAYWELLAAIFGTNK